MSEFLQKDEWLSDVLERQTFKLTVKEELLAVWQGWKSEMRLSQWQVSLPAYSFVYTKIPALAVHTAKILQELGFFLVDTQVSFEKTISAQNLSAPASVEVRLAQPNDEQGACSLAASAFRYSRFHLDPLIPRQLADRVKAEWVTNYFRGKRGDALVVALYEKKVVGFLQLLFNEINKEVVIDLIAVDESLRGKGIAAAMIYYAEHSFSSYQQMVVGTQIANTPSVRLYEKLGFRLRSAHYVYHYHHQLP